MSCHEVLMVEALSKLLDDQSWKRKVDSILDETSIRVQNSLDEQVEVLRLETDKIRGMESLIETQIDKVKSLLEQVGKSLEEDRTATDKLMKKQSDLSTNLLEEEANRVQLEDRIKELSGRALSTAELEKHFPEQQFRQSLFFKMVRVVFGKAKRERPHAFRGYVSNFAGNDVTPFEFDTLKVDQNRLTEFLWDYVADGVSEEFKK